jgi:hypothetical protein
MYLTSSFAAASLTATIRRAFLADVVRKTRQYSFNAGGIGDRRMKGSASCKVRTTGHRT